MISIKTYSQGNFNINSLILFVNVKLDFTARKKVALKVCYLIIKDFLFS